MSGSHVGAPAGERVHLSYIARLRGTGEIHEWIAWGVGYNQARLRRLNDARTAADGEYVLYWIQAARRLARNHALDYALACARELSRPLVVYEGLRLDYPWASTRIHRFVLEGMQANAERAAALGLNYWPFVERRAGDGRGLLRRLAERACLVVTDDFPAFVVPAQSAALARAAPVPVFAVDSNGIVPLANLGARLVAVEGDRLVLLAERDHADPAQLAVALARALGVGALLVDEHEAAHVAEVLAPALHGRRAPGLEDVERLVRAERAARTGSASTSTRRVPH